MKYINQFLKNKERAINEQHIHSSASDNGFSTIVQTYREHNEGRWCPHVYFLMLQSSCSQLGTLILELSRFASRSSILAREPSTS